LPIKPPIENDGVSAWFAPAVKVLERDKMRLAFVLRLGSDSRPDKGLLEGWVEEVDTCTEIRFRSTEELLKFLRERFEIAVGSSGKTATSEKDSSQKRRKSG
jgi:hypothetical protein